MEIIADIIRGIAVIILLFVCLELLLPKSELQPYIRMVMGLLLVAAVIYPLAGVSKNIYFDSVFSDMEFQTDQILSAGTQMREDWENTAQQEYTEDINNKIESILLLDKDIIDVNCDTVIGENDNWQVNLQIKTLQENAQKKEKWINTISAYFEIAKENINITCIRSE